MALERTRNNIIEQAVQKIGVVAAGEAVPAGIQESAEVQLDYLVKSWQATGAHLWSEEEGILFLQPGQVQYVLGDSASLDRAAASELDVNNTTLSADAVATDVILTVDSEVGIDVADFIGILLDTGALFWSTVASLAPLTINDALPSDAASGRVVWSYTTAIPKPLKIPASRRNEGGITGLLGQDISMTNLGREDYYNLPEKNSVGVPVQYQYQPKIDDGLIRIWPSPSSSTTFMKFTYWRPINVFDNSASAPDFPNEWLNALVYNLALNLMPNFAVNANAYPTVTGLASSYFNAALDWDSGTASVKFEVGFHGGQ